MNKEGVTGIREPAPSHQEACSNSGLVELLDPGRSKIKTCQGQSLSETHTFCDEKGSAGIRMRAFTVDEETLAHLEGFVDQRLVSLFGTYPRTV